MSTAGDPAKQQRRVAERTRAEALRRRQRRTRWLWWGGGGVTLVAVLVAVVFAARAQAAPTIDGIQCVATEGNVAHIHQHLAIYDRGQPFPVPADIGIDPTRGCLFALHTHSPDGVIHVEAPSSDTQTLGQFFDIWQTPLSRSRLLTRTATGSQRIRAYVNGRLYGGDLRAIPLTPHALITLEYGPPWAAPTTRFAWPQGT